MILLSFSLSSSPQQAEATYFLLFCSLAVFSLRIPWDNPAQIPATADFQDVNGDGKIDLIVHLGNQQFTYINDGTEFKPQQ